MLVRARSLPRTSSGKPRRHACRSDYLGGRLEVLAAGIEPPSVAENPVPVEFVPPRTATETVLAGIWQGVLSLPRVGARDNFVDLGGQSIQVTECIVRVRGAFGVDLDPSMFFSEAATVAEMSRTIESLRENTAEAAIRTVGHAIRGSSPRRQRRRWWRRAGRGVRSAGTGRPAVAESGRTARVGVVGGAVLAPPASVSRAGVPGARRVLDVGRLQRAINDVVARHEGLRTGFPDPARLSREDERRVRDGIAAADGWRRALFASTVHAAAEVDLRVCRAPSAGIDPNAPGFLDRVREEISRPFSYSEVPLVRATLVREHDARHALLLVLHHLIADWRSVQLFVHEIITAYRGGRTADAADSPSRFDPRSSLAGNGRSRPGRGGWSGSRPTGSGTRHGRLSG